MDIYNTIITQFKNIMNLRPVGFVTQLAKILSGTYKTLDNLIQWAVLQIYPTTAQDVDTTILGTDINPLSSWGSAVGLVKKQATQAELTIRVTSDTDQDYTLPVGTRFIYPATGVTYNTQQGYPILSGTTDISVLCDELGTVGNVDNNVILEVAEANSYILPEATVVGTTITAEDVESSDDFRDRILNRLRNPPIGGAYADYALWATEVEGVIAGYPYRGPNPGQVTVYVRDVDGVPSGTQLTDVENSINLPNRRPVGAEVFVEPVTEAEFSFTIEGLNPDTAQIRQAIQTTLENYLYNAEPFIAGYNFATFRKDRIVPAAISGEVNSAVVALGAVVNKVTTYKSVFLLEEPYSLQEGEIGKLKQVTYVQ